MNIKESVPNYKIKLLECSYNSAKRNKIRGRQMIFRLHLLKFGENERNALVQKKRFILLSFTEYSKPNPLHCLKFL